MNTTTRTSTAERLGRAFGRGWRAYARRERRASNWLVSKGMPRAGATALVWVAKLAVLGVLLYVAFWFALVMLGVAAAGWAAAANTSDEDEWPFTDLTELRKTPGYDPLKDLSPVITTGILTNVMVVAASNPANTVADVIAQARAKPGEKIRIDILRNGKPLQLTAEIGVRPPVNGS